MNVALRTPVTLQNFLAWEEQQPIPLADLYTGLALDGGSPAAQ